MDILNNIKKFRISFRHCILPFLFLLIADCSKITSPSSRDNPTNALERARKNVNEGKGMSIGNMLKRDKSTNYEFSTSNPMWRASLEVLDFLPLSVVDYSGGIIISDWYGDENSKNESLKITLRFLSNEVRSDSLKIIVHKKNCSINTNCTIKIINSLIAEELTISVLKKAAILSKDSKKN
jgi:hypothetical protein